MHKTFKHDARRLRRRRSRICDVTRSGSCHFHPRYDEDNGDTLAETLAFAERHKFYIVGSITSHRFRNTAIRPAAERRTPSLRKWWLDPEYRYGMVPFARAHDGRAGEAALHRSAPAVLRHQPRFSNAGLDFKVNSKELVHVESFLLDQPAVFVPRCCRGKIFPLGDESYVAPLIKPP